MLWEVLNLFFYACLEPVCTKKVVCYLVFRFFRCGWDFLDRVFCNILRRWNVDENILLPLQQFLIAAWNPARDVKLNALNPNNQFEDNTFEIRKHKLFLSLRKFFYIEITHINIKVIEVQIKQVDTLFSVPFRILLKEQNALDLLDLRLQVNELLNGLQQENF